MKKMILSLACLALAGNMNAQWAATPNTTGKTTLYANNLLFAGGADGMSVSADEGHTFTLKNNGLNVSAGNSYTAHVEVAGTVYTYSDKVYKTANNGTTWVACSNGLPTTSVVSNLYYYNSTLYATFQSGAIYSSTDGGASWAMKGNVGIYVVNMTSYDGAFYAGTNNGGMFKSTDGGATWAPANNGIASGDLQVYGAGVHHGEMYIGTYSGKIYKYAAATSSWSLIYTAAAGIRCFYEIGNALMVGSDAGFYYSLNDGATWQQDNAGLSGTALYILDVHSSNQNVFISDFYGGVYKRSFTEIGIVAPTAVGEVEKETPVVTLSPNPATSTLSIACAAAKITGYEIADLAGRVVLSGSNASHVDISTLGAGIYICKVMTGKGVAVQKFVKQ